MRNESNDHRLAAPRRVGTPARREAWAVASTDPRALPCGHEYVPFGARLNGNIKFCRLVLASLLAAAVSGCVGDELPNHPHPATTTPAGDVRLSDAKSLDDLDSDEDVQMTLTDKLSWPQTTQPVYFGEADQFDSDDSTTPVSTVPLIAIHDGKDWKGVPLIGPGLTDAGWKYVGAGPATGEVWGVLDTAAGDSQADFVVAHSIDGAMSFTLTVFSKPCRHAEVFDFLMGRNGHGRITLSLDADCGLFRAGLYHYDTVDDGKTWSKSPRYEADAMVRSDTVPDDQQPAPAEKPIRVLYRTRSNQAGSELIRRAGSFARPPSGSWVYLRTGLGK
jgi:hypothetical protein